MRARVLAAWLLFLALLLALLVGCVPQGSSELAEALNGSGAITLRQAANRWVSFRSARPILHGILGLGLVVSLLINALAATTHPGITAHGRARPLPWLLRSRTTFFVLAGVVLVLCRAPALTLPELNPDESQLLAGALALKHDPRFWRSLDGTTFGPLDYFALLLAELLGLTFDYGSAKFVGLLLAFGTLACLFACLRLVFSERMARLLSLPLLVLHGGVTSHHLLPYLSESLPCFLIALASAFVLQLSCGIRSRAGMAVLGFALAAIPFAKLQGTPVAFALGIAALWLCWRNPGANRGSATACLLLTSVVAPLFTLGALWAAGEIGGFWTSYFVFNLKYEVGPIPFWRRIWSGPSSWYHEPEFLALCVTCGLLCAFAASVLCIRRIQVRVSPPVLVALLLLCASLFVAIYPGRSYLHYLHFLPFPAVLLSGLLAGHAFLALPARAASRLLVLAGAVLLIGGEASRQLVRPSGASMSFIGGPVASTVLSYASPGEALSIWGWMPRYYVETGMHPVTRDVLTQRQIQHSPLYAYYRQRYIGELGQAPPPVFIDAVGPGNFLFTAGRRGAVAAFPELRSLLDSQYVQVGDVSGARIHARRDRVEELELGTLLRESPDTVLTASHPSTVRIELHTAGRAPILARSVTLLAPHGVGSEAAALLWSSAGGNLVGALSVLDAKTRQHLLPDEGAALDLTEHRDLLLAFDNGLDLSRSDLVVAFRGPSGHPLLTLRSP